MLGNLSRHISTQTSPSQIQYFNEYSISYKNVASCGYQNYSINNRTQGAIEQYFGYLKNVGLKGTRATGIYDFVHQYKKTVKTAERKFYDSVLHSPFFPKFSSRLPDPSQPIKCKNVAKLPACKFIKGKQRNTGYYTQNYDHKQLKYLNKVMDEKQRNKSDYPPVSNISPALKNDSIGRIASCVDFSDSSLDHVKSAASSIAQPQQEDDQTNEACTRFAWQCNHISNHTHYANAVWREALHNITSAHDYALFTMAGLQLSWADLLSVKSGKYFSVPSWSMPCIVR